VLIKEIGWNSNSGIVLHPYTMLALTQLTLVSEHGWDILPNFSSPKWEGDLAQPNNQ